MLSECKCSEFGVAMTSSKTPDLGCDEFGACNCNSAFTGKKCDKCANSTYTGKMCNDCIPNYYGFPNCQGNTSRKQILIIL